MIRDIIENSRSRKPKKPKHPVHFKRKLFRFLIHAIVWIGIAIGYYLAFSSVFDTPVEYAMRHSLRTLETEYEHLSARYDTLENILGNLIERDRNVFAALYDSYPAEFDEGEDRVALYDSLIGMSRVRLRKVYGRELDRLTEVAKEETERMGRVQARIEDPEIDLNRIPSIQPVINPELTLIATSFGRRIHPFYKTLSDHTGMDYAVPEGTRVFATADGVVTRVRNGKTNTGNTVIIRHGNGYMTQYHHLSAITVKEGEEVKRGDIIALSGNSGLSLAPHLHYEIRLNDLPVDPVHYFFHELDPEQYDRAIRIASVGMQSFD